MSEEYIRTELLIGSEGLGRLRESSVLVFGVGGVGSHCIEAMARSGVGNLILVVNDVVLLSNINRQSIALHSTVGRYKTEVMKEKIRDIDPGIRVDTHETFILSDNVEDVITGTEDYIIDAVDTVTAKLSIIQTALEKEIPVISSMGTGNKLHPEMFEITDISQTSVCPLCRVMRRELKARGISQLKVLFSKEKPVDTSGRTIGEDPGARRSIPGSIAFVPPVAGLMIAGEVIRELAGIR